MNGRYDWVEDFKAELDKLDESKSDYEQVRQLKLLEKMWEETGVATRLDLTWKDNIPYMILVKNEITEAFYEYLSEYIRNRDLLSECLTISTTTIQTQRKKLSFDIKNEDDTFIRSQAIYSLSREAARLDYMWIIKDMLGTDSLSDKWIPESAYLAFQEEKQNRPDWVGEHCGEFVNILIKLEENLKKEGQSDLA